ncbi:MAG: hypothetical protein HY543_06625 [Deltaproteobacteria bacterium]|nr:hypothetical protein [Deltaproteobacteria bacterium]
MWGGGFIGRIFGRRRAILDALREISIRLPITDAAIARYPAASCTGRCYSYPLAVECVRRGGVLRWRVHSELARPWQGRIVMYGEARHGTPRELYGMEVMVTGDAGFDAQFLVAATEDALARRLFTPYLRARCRRLPTSHLTIDCHDSTVYCEYTTGMHDPVRIGIPVITFLLDLMDRL